jgi:hypothetical protein
LKAFHLVLEAVVGLDESCFSQNHLYFIT